MQLTIKLFATLGRYLPPGAQRNVIRTEVDDGTTVEQLIQQLDLPAELTHLVLVNGCYVQPEDRGKLVFAPGDEFAVFPPIAGG